MNELSQRGLFAIITTIFPPTSCVNKLLKVLGSCKGTLVVAGDKKGPSNFEAEGSVFLSLEEQLKQPWRLARELPTGHYCRKNIGYLWAMAQGATVIYETDDDNAPGDGWVLRTKESKARCVDRPGWVNAYGFFGNGLIWPRGLPLNRIRDALPAITNDEVNVDAPIQQGLANGSPDVDAIWRLVLDRPYDFQHGSNVLLGSGTWCPFNSQNTWWWPEAYPLMYLPSYCSFRMTDIWRSFVAQRCLWALGKGVVFHAADVVQERNEHDLQKDFEAEVPGYLGNQRMIDLLSGLELDEEVDAVGSNLLQCYRALEKAGFFPQDELALVEAWCEAVEQLKG